MAAFPKAENLAHRELAMRRTSLMLALTLAFGSSIATFGTLNAEPSTDPRVADLVKASRVRVGLGMSIVGALKDPATGELRGVAVDLAHALAARIGVELLPVEYPTPPRVLDGLKDGAWDVGVFALDPSRLGQVDFSPPYLQVDLTYLVAPGSAIRNISDADQPGVRIAVIRNSVEDVILTSLLKRAAVLRVETSSGAGFDLLRDGNAEALASSRTTLLNASARLPGSRVLEDRFGVIEIAMAVAKGQAARMAYISDFIEEAKASGLVQRAIERAGVRGFQVAPRR
jgi:polar amino acid transport system substrate-binding protein